jgi:hypothetical protein
MCILKRKPEREDACNYENKNHCIFAGKQVRLKAPVYHICYKSPNLMTGVRSENKLRDCCLYISLLDETHKNFLRLLGLEVYY